MLLLQKCTIHCTQAAVSVHGTVVIKDCIVEDGLAQGLISKKQQSKGCLGEVTVKDGADLVCEGNNTSNVPGNGDFVSVRKSPITGVAEEKITIHPRAPRIERRRDQRHRCEGRPR